MAEQRDQYCQKPDARSISRRPLRECLHARRYCAIHAHCLENHNRCQEPGGDGMGTFPVPGHVRLDSPHFSLLELNKAVFHEWLSASITSPSTKHALRSRNKPYSPVPLPWFGMGLQLGCFKRPPPPPRSRFDELGGTEKLVCSTDVFRYGNQ